MLVYPYVRRKHAFPFPQPKEITVSLIKPDDSTQSPVSDPSLAGIDSNGNMNLAAGSDGSTPEQQQAQTGTEPQADGTDEQQTGNIVADAGVNDPT